MGGGATISGDQLTGVATVRGGRGHHAAAADVVVFSDPPLETFIMHVSHLTDSGQIAPTRLKLIAFNRRHRRPRHEFKHFTLTHTRSKLLAWRQKAALIRRRGGFVAWSVLEHPGTRRTRTSFAVNNVYIAEAAKD